MLEAYNDFSRFENLHFVRDVYGKYRELEAMGYAGTLMTDVFAGDTRVSEREFLTGLPYARIDKFVAPSNSYVWYFRENGYHTTGSHPCYAWFYNRKNINKNLGFAEYLFSENYFAERTWNDITYDAAYFPMLYELYESRDRSAPYFSYNITYQGHGPYEADNPYYTEPYVENGGWSEASQTILNNYLNAQAETTAMLYDFATQMLGRSCWSSSAITSPGWATATACITSWASTLIARPTRAFATIIPHVTSFLQTMRQNV